MSVSITPSLWTCSSQISVSARRFLSIFAERAISPYCKRVSYILGSFTKLSASATTWLSNGTKSIFQRSITRDVLGENYLCQSQKQESVGGELPFKLSTLAILLPPNEAEELQKIFNEIFSEDI